MLFGDSADKAARFIWLCNAFNVPLVFLADVPGFMIGSQVEREGIIRHGAKMITAVSEATVPEVRASSSARRTARACTRCADRRSTPDACLALPSAKIAVMGPEAAVNAVFYNRIQAIDDPDAAGRLRRRAAPRLRGGRRPPPPGQRPRHRRGRAARGPPPGAGGPHRPRARQVARLHRAPQRRATRCDHPDEEPTMTTGPPRLLLDGLHFGEGPRWHDGRLYLSRLLRPRGQGRRRWTAR